MNTSQPLQYGGTVHLFIGTGCSPVRITFMSVGGKILRSGGAFIVDEHTRPLERNTVHLFWMNTRTLEGLSWFRPLERNTLPPLSVSCIDRVPCNVVSPPFYSLREVHTRMLSYDMRA
jgi:hypothetical protein